MLWQRQQIKIQNLYLLSFFTYKNCCKSKWDFLKWLFVVKCYPWESLKCRASASFRMFSASPISGPLYTTKSSLSDDSSSKGCSFVLWRLTTNIKDSETILTLNKTINKLIIGVKLSYLIHEILQTHYFVSLSKLIHPVLLTQFVAWNIFLLDKLNFFYPFLATLGLSIIVIIFITILTSLVLVIIIIIILIIIIYRVGLGPFRCVVGQYPADRQDHSCRMDGISHPANTFPVSIFPAKESGGGKLVSFHLP